MNKKKRHLRTTWVTAVACLCTLSTLTAYPPSAPAFTAQTLVLGSRGYDVNELQSRLRLLGFYKDHVDGNFGWDTYWAVRVFQQKFLNKPTGVVNLNTRQALVRATPNWHSSSINSHFAPTTSPTVHTTRSYSASAQSDPFPATAGGLSSHDLTLMAHVVYAEARGEPFKGQVAVAAVLLNRIKSAQFPNSIPAIVYQPRAFTSVADGQVNLQPNAQSMKAVMLAVHGWDPSHGALYYFNPATSTSSWIWSKPEITKIGKHIFSM